MFYGGYLDSLIADMQTRRTYYLIRLRRDDKMWYLFDAEYTLKAHRVMWVPNVDTAFKFNSEEEVEDFVSEFIAPRKVEIVEFETGIVF